MIWYASVMFAVCLIFAAMAVKSFMQKGYLFNNAYIYSTKEQRDNMDKKPYYIQSGVVFSILSAAMLADGLNFIFKKNYFVIAAIILFTAALIYAVVSSIIIAKKH